MSNLSPAQISCLRVILRHGGKVVACMGRVKGNRVNKATVARLAKAGMIVSAGRAVNHSGPVLVDLTVTAAGCLIVHATEAHIKD